MERAAGFESQITGRQVEVLPPAIGPAHRFRALARIPIRYGREAPLGIRGAPAFPAIGWIDPKVVASADRPDARPDPSTAPFAVAPMWISLLAVRAEVTTANGLPPTPLSGGVA